MQRQKLFLRHFCVIHILLSVQNRKLSLRIDTEALACSCIKVHLSRYHFFLLLCPESSPERSLRVLLKDEINLSLCRNSREFDSFGSGGRFQPPHRRVPSSNRHACIRTCTRTHTHTYIHTWTNENYFRVRGRELHAGRAGRIFVLLRDD